MKYKAKKPRNREVFCCFKFYVFEFKVRISNSNPIYLSFSVVQAHNARQQVLFWMIVLQFFEVLLW